MLTNIIFFDESKLQIVAFGLGEVITPRVLGVDDWTMRKGHSYGAILVDLESHKVVDLLPEKKADSLSAWLKEHPGVEIISRDRDSEYIKGANDGAPFSTVWGSFIRHSKVDILLLRSHSSDFIQ